MKNTGKFIYFLFLASLLILAGASLGYIAGNEHAKAICAKINTPVLNEVSGDIWTEKIQDTLGNIHYDTLSRYIVIRSVEGSKTEPDVYSVLLPDNTAYDGLSLHEIKTVLQGKEIN